MFCILTVSILCLIQLVFIYSCSMCYLCVSICDMSPLSFPKGDTEAQEGPGVGEDMVTEAREAMVMSTTLLNKQAC